MQGMLDPKFLKRTNGTMVCPTCAIPCHSLRALQTRVYEKAPNCNPEVVGGARVPIIAFVLINELTIREQNKIFFFSRRTRGRGSPRSRKTYLY